MHRRLSSPLHPRLIKIETIPLNPLAMKGEYVMSVAVRPAREQAVHESAIPAPATCLRVRSATHTAPSIWYIAAEIKTSTGGALLSALPAGTPRSGAGTDIKTLARVTVSTCRASLLGPPLTVTGS
jgi:hypothetical protein